MRNYEEYYEDVNIYENIINEYNIEKQDVFYDMYLELLHNIYTLKIMINKNKSNYIKNINKNNKINNDFIYYTNKWTLNDSCNNKILKNKIINIKNNYKELSALNLSNNTIINNIKSYYTQIEQLILNYKSNINNKYFIKNIIPITENIILITENIIPITENKIPITENKIPITENKIPITENKIINNKTINNKIENNNNVLEEEDLHMNSIINY